MLDHQKIKQEFIAFTLMLRDNITFQVNRTMQKAGQRKFQNHTESRSDLKLLLVNTLSLKKKKKKKKKKKELR